MKRPATRRSYAARIEKVVEHLASHLDQPLTLEHLAGIGHFSPFHFHRIYRGLMGETVAGTLRRMRLHRAAAELVHGRRTLESIARRCGYGSSAAFNRAFAHSYGMPPGEFRRRRGGPVEPPPCPDPSDPEDSRMYDAKDVKIETLPLRDVAALRHQGDYLEIGTAFEKLFAWAAGRGLDPARQRSFGIYYDDPESKPAADLVSDACIEIQPGMELDGGPRHITIAGGRHAVFIHTGPYAELERAYRWLFGEWLPASGEEAADAPVVEEYLNDPRSLPPTEWQTAICVPLK